MQFVCLKCVLFLEDFIWSVFLWCIFKISFTRNTTFTDIAFIWLLILPNMCLCMDCFNIVHRFNIYTVLFWYVSLNGFLNFLFEKNLVCRHRISTDLYQYVIIKLKFEKNMVYRYHIWLVFIWHVPSHGFLKVGARGKTLLQTLHVYGVSQGMCHSLAY